ncbi:MAG TPA: hypothetical protein DCY03_14140, partial [Planctomycetaceae bacterium]|nr:hypothetical protein [Planctomycetaceae bacterium]
MEPGMAGTVRYIPPAGFTGQDTFTYIVTYPDGTDEPTVMVVEVAPTNDSIATAREIELAFNESADLNGGVSRFDGSSDVDYLGFDLNANEVIIVDFQADDPQDDFIVSLVDENGDPLELIINPFDGTEYYKATADGTYYLKISEGSLSSQLKSYTLSLTRQADLARDDSLVVFDNLLNQIDVTAFLGNDGYENGADVTLVNLSALTQESVAVTHNGAEMGTATQISYSPNFGLTVPPADIRDDAFYYQVQDASGRVYTGLISLTVKSRIPQVQDLQLVIDTVSDSQGPGEESDGATSYPVITGRILDHDHSSSSYEVQIDIDGNEIFEEEEDLKLSGAEFFTADLSEYVTAGVEKTFKVRAVEGDLEGEWQSITFTYATVDHPEIPRVTVTNETAEGEGIEQAEHTTFTFKVALDDGILAPVGGITLNAYLDLGNAEPEDFELFQGETLSFTGGKVDPVQVSILEGQNEATITVVIMDDNLVETAEDFTVFVSHLAYPGDLSDLTGVVGQAGGTIDQDIDDTASLSVSVNPQAEGNPDFGEYTDYIFTVTLTGEVEGGFDLTYDVQDGTARIVDGDYVLPESMLVSFAGTAEEAQDITVQVKADQLVERDEDFILLLGSLLNLDASLLDKVTLASTPVTGTITNDDIVKLSVTDHVTRYEGQSGTTKYVFTVSLDQPVDIPISVTASTVDGTATVADNDYVANSEILNFAANETGSRTFTVEVNSDTEYEADETFQVVLTNLIADGRLAGLDLSELSKTGTILNDDDPVYNVITVNDFEDADNNNLPTITFSEALKMARSNSSDIDVIRFDPGLISNDEVQIFLTAPITIDSNVIIDGSVQRKEDRLVSGTATQTAGAFDVGDYIPDGTETFTVNSRVRFVISPQAVDFEGPMITVNATHDDDETLTTAEFKNLIIDGENSGKLPLSNVGDLTLNNVTVTASVDDTEPGFVRNQIDASGGGIVNAANATLTLNESVVSGHSVTGEGGAIYNTATAELILNSSTIENNTATGNGAGIFNESGGTIHLNRSTVSGNISETGNGGGIYNAGDLFSESSTISGNTADTNGGGIYNSATGELTVTSNTIAFNTVTTGTGAGIYNGNAAEDTARLQNTIVAKNTDDRDISGEFQSNGYNLIGSLGETPPPNFFGFSLAANDIFDSGGDVVDPKLDENLTYNGGFTKTHLLLPGSGAIDKGCVDIESATDQRGAPRVLDGLDAVDRDGNPETNDTEARIDIGAVEFGSFFVNTLFDTPITDSDADPEVYNDGIIDVSEDDGYQVSLRAAILEVNALAGINHEGGAFDAYIIFSDTASTFYYLEGKAASDLTTVTREDFSRTGDLDIYGNVTIRGAGSGTTYISGGEARASVTKEDDNAEEQTLTVVTSPALEDRIFHVHAGARLQLEQLSVMEGHAVEEINSTASTGWFDVDASFAQNWIPVETEKPGFSSLTLFYLGNDDDLYITGTVDPDYDREVSWIEVDYDFDGSSSEDSRFYLEDELQEGSDDFLIKLDQSQVNRFAPDTPGGNPVAAGFINLRMGYPTVDSQPEIPVEGSGKGGGVFNEGGTLTLVNTEIGLGSGDPVLDNPAGLGNSADVQGGGVYSKNADGFTASVTLSHSKVTGNTAYQGGGIYIESGTATVTDESLVGDNIIIWQGGGIYLEDGELLISGESQIVYNNHIASGQTVEGVGLYLAGGTTTINGQSQVIANAQRDVSSGSGGGIYNSGHLTIEEGSLISGNATLTDASSGYSGAGIYNTGELLLNDSRITNHFLDVGRGAGIFNTSTGTVIANRSEISGNGVWISGDAGGIFNDGGIVELNYSELVRNNGGVASVGGAIVNLNGTLTLDHTTLTGNYVMGEGGG